MFKFWNYRIIRHPATHGCQEHFAVHEVHYDESGLPVAVTENPIKLVADSPDDLVEDLKLMQEAASKPTLDYVLFYNQG